MAITVAVCAQLAEPVIDLHISIPLRVTTGDVRAAARDHFGLATVTSAQAAAILRQRLEWRGHAGWPDLVADAYDYQS
ncbi:hypothetical protein [Streptomyces sp. NPDC058644]|uniref:hypothetical protein n=1 Tax=unclassified Streptomyces TaxID=2593676 RepID=UPI003663B336